jgi:GNAT superfamily N-acetyltransferase
MNDQRIEIRRATVTEANIIAEQRVVMFRDMGTLDQSLEGLLLNAATSQIRDAMASGEYVAWLAHPADEPQRIVGGSGVQLRRLFPRPADDGKTIRVGREGIVLNVYVEREFRRRGLARRLMEEILAWLPSTDVVRLVLHASDDGRPLYESLGFVPTTEMRYTGLWSSESHLSRLVMQ